MATFTRAVVAPRFPGVLADRLGTRRGASVLLALSGAAIVGLFAQISIPLPFTPVPLTGQTLGVLLVSAALGPRRGTMSLVVYVVAGIAGLPMYAGGTSGWTAVAGPTGGYLIGFVPAALLVGGMAARGLDRRPGTMLVIYLVGASWLAHVLGIGATEAFALGVAPFLVGDALKALIAAGLLPTAWRLAQRFE